MHPAETGPLLRVQHLTIRHPDGRELVSHASFESAPGEIVLLMGPSGSGKSTLLTLLSGLLGCRGGWQVEGHCHLPGETVGLAERHFAAGAIVFQNYALFD